MEARHVHVDHDGSVAILRIDRPPVNALELGLARETVGVLDDLVAGGAGAIVVTGTAGVFSAGLDLKVVPFYGRDEQREMVDAANRFLLRLYGCPRPVVAAVNGHAIAGGFVLAIACDYRVGTEAPCKLGLTEARAGIPFPGGAMAVLRAELTPAAARVLTLVARNIAPAAALARGIVDELQPADRVLSRAVEVARDLAGIPREAYARIKHQLRRDVVASLEEMIARGTDPMLTSWIGDEAPDAATVLLREERGS